MRNILTVSTALILAVFFIDCSTVKIPTQGDLGRKARRAAKAELTEGTVEVLESTMEKTEGYDFSDDKGIIITGKAKYIPAKVKPEPFEDFDGEFQFNLLDANGNKVRTFYSGGTSTEMGEYGNRENVEPNKPFPFKIESKQIDLEDWEKIAAHEFIRWH